MPRLLLFGMNLGKYLKQEMLWILLILTLEYFYTEHLKNKENKVERAIQQRLWKKGYFKLCLIKRTKNNPSKLEQWYIIN